MSSVKKMKQPMLVINLLYFMKQMVEYLEFNTLYVNCESYNLLKSITRKVKFNTDTPHEVLVAVITTRPCLFEIDCTRNVAIDDDVVQIVLTTHSTHLQTLKVDYCQNLAIEIPFIPSIWISKKGCWKIVEFGSWLTPCEIVDLIACGIRCSDNTRLRSLFICWHNGFYDIKAWIAFYQSFEIQQEVVYNKTMQLAQVVMKVGYYHVSLLLFRRHYDTWWRVYSIQRYQPAMNVMDDEAEITKIILKLLGTCVCQN